MEATTVSIPGVIVFTPQPHMIAGILQPHVRCRGRASGRTGSGGVCPRQHVALRQRGHP